MLCMGSFQGKRRVKERRQENTYIYIEKVGNKSKREGNLGKTGASQCTGERSIKRKSFVYITVFERERDRKRVLKLIFLSLYIISLCWYSHPSRILILGKNMKTENEKKWIGRLIRKNLFFLFVWLFFLCLFLCLFIFHSGTKRKRKKKRKKRSKGEKKKRRRCYKA